MNQQDDVQYMLGKIEGHIHGIHTTLQNMEQRLGATESRAISQGGRKGAETGGLVSLGVWILSEAIRQRLGLKGG